ncbi:replication factor C subunit 1 isoform X2 [Anabrus simplex]
MSKDIRSYFLPKGMQNNRNVENKPLPSKKEGKKSHKRIYVIDSDSEGEKSPPKRNKVSDREPKDSKSTRINKTSSDLKPVNVADAFGTTKVKRSTEKNVTKKSDHPQVSSKSGNFEETHSDPDFEETLRQVDELEAAYLEKEGKKDVPDSHMVVDSRIDDTYKQFTPEQSKGESKASNISKEVKKAKERKQTEEHTQIKQSLPHSSKHATMAENEEHKIDNQETYSPNGDHTKRKRESPDFRNDESSKTKEKKQKHESLNKRKENDDPVIKVNSPKQISKCPSSGPKSPSKKLDIHSPSVDPIEKKREHAIHYLKYLQREGPKHLGSKEIPKGKPGCLSGLTFVITGVLDSLEREQAVNIIKDYGGRVTSAVSKKTSYLIRGDDPGTSKIDKAVAFGTPQIDEDGLFKLIVEKSSSLPDNQREGFNGKKFQVKKEDTVGKIETPDKKKYSPSDPSVPEPDLSILPHQDEESAQTLKSESKKENLHSTEPSLWVEKYRPVTSKQIIGQQGDRSAMKKLMIWLKNWHKNHSGNKKLPRPSPWAKNDDGAYFKAALLSGPPGIGKTTMSHVISKELGFDIVEFNASDTRSKSRLHDEVSTLLSSQSLYGYFHESGPKTTSPNHVLIMDEVDGMAGNEDRGGVQELIQLIKNSQVPIICTCNDRNHPKIRSLVNYCFDLRVTKPRVEQIRGSMMSICFKEGLKIPADAMTDMIIGANQDIRQILNHMAMWTAKNKSLSSEEAKLESEKAKKDLKMGPWDVLKKVFSAEDHKTMSIFDKSDLFFYDYSLSPLFVQENYLSVVPIHAEGKILKTLDLVAKAADSISMGDVVDRAIRNNNAWSLLPVQAMFSSVLPGDYMEGYLRSQINFPSWLGKNSRRNKLDRLLQELQVHMRLTTSASKEAINLDYLPSIRDAVFNPLIQDGTSGIPAALKVMEDYHLIREDLESIIELSTWPGDKDPMTLIDSKVKAAMTRAYNKEGIMTPYSVVSVVKKQVAGSSQDLVGNEEVEEDAVDEDKDDEDITHDAMIKAKKRTATKVQHKEAGHSDSKGKGKGKGKGKKKAE